MEILQRDIFGVAQKEEPKEKPTPALKQYREITVADGIDDKVASSDAMLIHRTIQRKMLYSGNIFGEKLDLLQKVLENEMMIKNGELDAVSATRDSLLSFYVRKK